MSEEIRKNEVETDNFDEKLHRMKTENYFITLIIIGVVFAANALALGVIQRISLLNNMSAGVELLIQYIQESMIQGMIIGTVWIAVGFVLLSYYRSQKN
ncbi:MAG: hypothetical protein ACFFEV_06195 [Candidatus Thorarchaeota archaeon]